MDISSMSSPSHAIQDEISERPLITLALFAFNQEKFVGDAIRAALAQTYSPLEIILSDDVSSDRTFAIMQEMAKSYQGPHSVKARQSPENAGTLAHVLSVAREAQGEIFVVAAGDDLSVPERVETIAREFDPRLAVAYSSDEIPMNAVGEDLDCPPDFYAHREALHRANPGWITGATAAYRRNFLSELPMPDSRVLFEDQAFIDLMRLRQERAVRSTSRLVRYRSHDANVYGSQKSEKDETQLEAVNQKIWSGTAISKGYALATAGGKADASLVRAVRSEQGFYESLASWTQPGRGISGRISLLKHSLTHGALGLALPRCLPAPVFFRVKRMISNLRGKTKS